MAPPKKKPVSRAVKQKPTKMQKTKANDQIEKEPEIVDEQPPPPKPDSWLDHLPPVIKPDEELHKKLSAERKEATRKKHMKICREELESIFNFALKTTEIEDENRAKRITRLKIDFLSGEFIPKPPPEEHQKTTVSNSISFVSGQQSPPSLQVLLKSNEYTDFEAMKQLSQISSGESVTFDGNPVLDDFLKRLSEDMKPYTEPAPLPEPVDFPFICCVVGPPCSGKSTICNFIKTYFNVVFIENTGDVENFPQRVLSELPNLPKGRGVLICNFPSTKAQLTALERALQSYLKSKQDNAQQFSQIHLLFRCIMSYEDVEKQIAGRMCTPDNNLIFHQTFNPPNVLQTQLELVEQPPPQDLQQIYHKALQASSTFESITKKGSLYAQIPLLDHIDRLELMIENNIRQLYDQSSMPVPFTSFVNYVDNEKLKYAKKCNDVLNIWINDCTPVFSKNLADLYMKTITVKNQINYLAEQAREKFSLMLARPDSRHVMAEEFRKNPNDYGKFFKEIWDKSIEIKENQIKWTSEVLRKSGLSLLKGFMGRSEEVIFTSLIQRLFLVDWFFKTFKNMEEADINCKPEIPEFDNHNLSQLSELLKVKDFIEVLKEKEILEGEQRQKNTSKNTLSNNKSNIEPPKFQKKLAFSKINKVQEKITIEPEPEPEKPPQEPVPQFKFESLPHEVLFKQFLEYLFSEMTKKNLRADTKLILQIYTFLIEEKKLIDENVDKNIVQLKSELAKWVDKKYSKEMEMFAKKFRAFKAGVLNNVCLFEFDLSFANEIDNIKEIISRLAPKLPSIENQISLPMGKVADLIKAIISKNKHTFNLSELLECGKEADFTDDEIDLLEIMARMTALTDFIDVKEFAMSLIPDSSVSVDFKDMIESSEIFT
ncbi:hypothetical protein TRFO_02634 [Tritrichomonas foetus]|uniref:Uncharacterized protein n=1 Tax=Tritrichomonas foetus TaxID=1144522 RepID=A0A1J4L369_9EUKA|nr:hypothetical protein TRFO_02634 [Tritrichomonas foetus]|eukprot:OHT16398.1 hypothetical protein TRFO_02634 [Tritrichomonas foetus]